MRKCYHLEIQYTQLIHKHISPGMLFSHTHSSLLPVQGNEMSSLTTSLRQNDSFVICKNSFHCIAIIVMFLNVSYCQSLTIMDGDFRVQHVAMLSPCTMQRQGLRANRITEEEEKVDLDFIGKNFNCKIYLKVVMFSV